MARRSACPFGARARKTERSDRTDSRGMFQATPHSRTRAARASAFTGDDALHVLAALADRQASLVLYLQIERWQYTIDDPLEAAQAADAPKRPPAIDREEGQDGRRATNGCPVRTTERERGAVLKLPQPHNLRAAIRMSPSLRTDHESRTCRPGGSGPGAGRTAWS
jgi:hypothetical protein